MRLRRRRERALHRHLGGLHGRRDVAALHVGQVRVRPGLGGCVLEGEHRLAAVVADLDQPCRRGGLLPGLGDDHRDVLAVMTDLCVLKRRRRGRVQNLLQGALGLVQSAGVLVGDHREHAGCGRGAGGIQARDCARGDRAAHQGRVRHVRPADVRGVVRGARDLQAPVDAVDTRTQERGRGYGSRHELPPPATV